MKNKIAKKPVDSIVKRKKRHSLVLSVKKIPQKPEMIFLMQNSAMKIIAAMLIIILNWLGISAIGKTSAFFNDSETSYENTFSAGTLDFSLSSPTDGFVLQNGNEDAEAEHEEDNGEKDKENEENDRDNEAEREGLATREIKIKNEGSLLFQYAPFMKEIKNDPEFCGALEFKATLRGEIKYSGLLADFNLENNPVVIGDGGEDAWEFSINLPSGDKERGKGHNNDNDSEQGELCRFIFSFRAWQADLAPEYGFGAEKEIQNSLELDLKGNDKNKDDNDDDENQNPPQVSHVTAELPVVSPLSVNEEIPFDSAAIDSVVGAEPENQEGPSVLQEETGSAENNNDISSVPEENSGAPSEPANPPENPPNLDSSGDYSKPEIKSEPAADNLSESSL